jgi:hypothetical protein
VNFVKKYVLFLTFLIRARRLQHMSRPSKQLLDENDAHCREIMLHAFFTQVPVNFSRHSGISSGQK